MDIDSKYINIYNGLLEKLDCELNSGDVFQILYYLMDSILFLFDNSSTMIDSELSETLSILIQTCIQNEKFMEVLKSYDNNIYQSFIGFKIKNRSTKINTILSIISQK